MKKAILLLSLLLLISCGKSPSSAPKQVTLSEADIMEVLQGQRFSCASVNGDPCPEGIVRVFVVDPATPAESRVCTGFLTASNKIVTNHHCVSTPEECAHTYFSISGQGRHEIAQCSRLIKTIDDGSVLAEKILDVAVLELDRHLTISPLVMASSSPKSGSRVSVWAMDQMDILNGRVTELECLLTDKDKSHELLFCPTVSGNSGSPVLNSEQQVIGILWGSTLDHSFTSLMDLQERRSLMAISFATDIKYFRSYSLP